MDLYLDTANIEEIRKGLDLGILSGVTTNPSLILKTGKKYKEVLKEICDCIPDLPVSAEIVEEEPLKMIEEAKELSKIASNIVIKIPITKEGLSVINYLTTLKIKTNATLCFSPLQALLSAKAGASYVSPFVGRLSDVGSNGFDLIGQIKQIYYNYSLSTEIIVASIRGVSDVLSSALIGANIATIPFKILEKMVYHPLTEKGIKIFKEDYDKGKIQS